VARFFLDSCCFLSILSTAYSSVISFHRDPITLNKCFPFLLQGGIGHEVGEVRQVAAALAGFLMQKVALLVMSVLPERETPRTAASGGGEGGPKSSGRRQGRERGR
jgi:hypothetical protein